MALSSATPPHPPTPLERIWLYATTNGCWERLRAREMSVGACEKKGHKEGGGDVIFTGAGEYFLNGGIGEIPFSLRKE